MLNVVGNRRGKYHYQAFLKKFRGKIRAMMNPLFGEVAIIVSSARASLP